MKLEDFKGKENYFRVIAISLDIGAITFGLLGIPFWIIAILLVLAYIFWSIPLFIHSKTHNISTLILPPYQQEPKKEEPPEDNPSKRET